MIHKILHINAVQKSIFVLVASFLIFGMQSNAFCQDTISQNTSKQDTITKTKYKISFKDSLDGAFDVSDVLINAHGFIPVPIIITEKSLGGIGGLLSAIFIQPPKQQVKASKSGRLSPVRPTIAGVAGMYTANKSWAIGGGYSSEWIKHGIIYSFGTVYADINMDFYKSFPTFDDDIHATFNFQAIPVMLSARKSFGGYFAAGLKYIFAYTDVKLSDKDTLPGHYYFNELLEKIETKSIMSRLSPTLTFDSRDNMFSPNNGLRLDAQLDWSDKILGSDFDYLQASVAAFGYRRFLKPWVASLRLEWKQMFEDPAFYMLPEIALRGVPAYRYQGSITTLAETEHRFDVYKRWSVVGFAGIAKAFDTYSDFDKADWIYNYGGGIRYLLARKFNLQMGVDLGFGPEDWGVYIVFGSGWLRD